VWVGGWVGVCVGVCGWLGVCGCAPCLHHTHPPTHAQAQFILQSLIISKHCLILNTCRGMTFTQMAVRRLISCGRMSGLLDAAGVGGDLDLVKRLLAEGANIAERRPPLQATALLHAALWGRLETVKWLLVEGGAQVTERDGAGLTATHLAAMGGMLEMLQWLLQEGGADIAEATTNGNTVWDELIVSPRDDVAKLSSLIKVMVMLADAPPAFIAKLSPEHAELCTRGKQLRAQLPEYLEQQRASVTAHCPLPAALQSLVASYAVTTPADMWTADGPRAQATRAKRARAAVAEEAEEEEAEEGEGAPPLRRSLRLRHKRG